MRVPCLLALVACSSAATAPGTGGCGPDCLGTCFAGNCLFGDSNLDNEDISRSSLPQVAAPAVTAAVTPNQPAAPLPSWGLVHNPGTPSAGPGGMAFDAMGVDPVSAVLPPHPAQLLQSNLGPAGLSPASAIAGLGFQSATSDKAQELSYELQRAEAHDYLLQAQNQELRHQLDQWKVTGQNIAQREAKVVELLANSKTQLPASTGATASAAPPAVAPTPLNLGARPEPSMLQKAEAHIYNGGPHSSLQLLRMMVVILFMAVVVWKGCSYFGSWRKGEISLSVLSQAIASSPSSKRFQPVLRAMGLAQYRVEVSEIHLGSLFAGSCDVRVNFRTGNGIERRTRVNKNGDATFLRFDDVLELSVCSKDAACTICVTDRRGDLAHVELSAKELIRLSTRPHQEYFRTELTACRELGDESGRRPYVAMRLRNVVPTPATSRSAAAAAEKGAADGLHIYEKQADRAYGSFAV